MKKITGKQIETFVYGVMGLLFSAAFFFGVLYPSHGISPEAYEVVEPPRRYAQMPDADVEEMAKLSPEKSFREQMDRYERDQIRYTSFLYECLKNS